MPAWTLSMMPGKRRRSSTVADSSRAVRRRSDRSGIRLGHDEHARSMGLATWAQQAERGVASGDGCHDCTPRADWEATINGCRGSSSGTEGGSGPPARGRLDEARDQRHAIGSATRRGLAGAASPYLALSASSARASNSSIKA